MRISDPGGTCSGKRRRSSTVLCPDMISKACSGRMLIMMSLATIVCFQAFFASLPPCLVGLEACGSAHHWARELMKLGHDARMMPPAYVKPYVRRQKNDAA